MKALVTPPFLSIECEDKEGTQSWSKAVSWKQEFRKPEFLIPVQSSNDLDPKL